MDEETDCHSNKRVDRSHIAGNRDRFFDQDSSLIDGESSWSSSFVDNPKTHLRDTLTFTIYDEACATM